MWKMGLVVFAGIILILTSIRIPTPRKIFRTKAKKETTPIEVEVQKPEVPSMTQAVEPSSVINPPIQIIDLSHKSETPIKKTRKVSVKVDSTRKSNVKEK